MGEGLTALMQPWADLYAESVWLPTTVIAVHVVAMFVGGGIALGADRRVVLAPPGDLTTLSAVVTELQGTHSLVIAALVVTLASGAALFAADVGTFLGSPVFLGKMSGVAILVANGVRMRRAERALLAALSGAEAPGSADAGGTAVAPLWRTLRGHAWISAGFWLLVVLLGVVTANL